MCLLKAYKREGVNNCELSFLQFAFSFKIEYGNKIMRMIRWNSSLPSVFKQLNAVVLLYRETICEERVIISILDEGIESQKLGSLPKVVLPVSGGAGIPFQLILSKEATLLLTPVPCHTASCAARMAFVPLCSAMYLS